MTGKTHILGGCAFGLAASILHPQADLFSTFLLTAVSSGSSLIPDIDNRRSKIGSRAKMTASVIQHTVGHRTLFHSPILYFILYCLGTLCIPTYFVPFLNAFTLGIVSHLMLDLLNKKGIPLFYPYKKHFHIAKIRSGSFSETVFSFLLILAIILELYFLCKP